MQRSVEVRPSAAEVGLWQDALELPQSLAATLDAADGFAEVAELLAHRSVQRIVVTGNGASYYVGLNLWLSSLTNAAAAAARHVVAIPIGLVATGHFRWRKGDLLLAVSSSGEFRDVVDAVLDAAAPAYRAAITSTPDSTLAGNVHAQALVSVLGERAVTHTQAYCGAIAASLAIWARTTSDTELERSVRHAVERYAALLATAELWSDESLAAIETPRAGVAFGSGPALAAANEVALLMREVARVPWEGAETREGATTSMYSLGPGHLVLSVGSDEDRLLHEAEGACSGSGATVLRLPGVGTDERLAAITSFPAALRASIVLALREGHDVDRPGWTDDYYATARPADWHARAGATAAGERDAPGSKGGRRPGP
jgi:fructoselysine-6-P-deglycase FrlB-like protein